MRDQFKSFTHIDLSRRVEKASTRLQKLFAMSGIPEDIIAAEINMIEMWMTELRIRFPRKLES
jgi:hypothetical protein